MNQTPGNNTGNTTRRSFILVGATVAAGALLRFRSRVSAVEAKGSVPKEVKIVRFSDTGKRQDVVTLPVVVKTETEWQQQLPPASFQVTRHEGTERAFSGEYWNLHDKGLYRCICCDTALFSSDTKFESGTGWPSFWEPIAKENVHETSDFSLGMARTAVSCRLCDAHLGHVFDDGPRPTGLRYCMNSVALRFVKFA